MTFGKGEPQLTGTAIKAGQRAVPIHPHQPLWTLQAWSVSLLRPFCLPLVAVALGGYHGGHHGGHSKQYRKQDDYGHYKFGYDIVDGHGSINGRHETGSAYGPVHGSYYLGIIDGRHRQVHYVADKWGFRAMVKTNEPGTKTSLPAAAPYHSANGKTVPAYGIGGGHGTSSLPWTRIPRLRLGPRHNPSEY
ncbi:hypothetical protein MRX96_009657 [Rhipicephalus microplus]